MGGGTSYHDDVPKTAPIDLIQASRSLALEVGAGGTLKDATQFCSRSHRASFVIEDSHGAAVGAPVRLELQGETLTAILANSGSPMGSIDAASADALAGCLRVGYVMAGHVDVLDITLGRGEVIVSGTKHNPN